MKVSLPPYVHSYPAPAVLVGCGTVEKPNLITISWFGTVCSLPPMVSISIRSSRHSFRLVEESGEFTINLPRVGELEAVKFCGDKSGRDTDKFKELGLTPVVCPPLKKAPMVREFFLSLGCRVRQQIPLGTHHIFIGEVVGMWVEEEFARSPTRANPIPDQQLVWVDKKYWGLHYIGA
jgi:flavin reductase (DIM6/NTAB) family NADH-FMN oxidoreductase RutF